MYVLRTLYARWPLCPCPLVWLVWLETVSAMQTGRSCGGGMGFTRGSWRLKWLFFLHPCLAPFQLLQVGGGRRGVAYDLRSAFSLQPSAFLDKSCLVCLSIGTARRPRRHSRFAEAHAASQPASPLALTVGCVQHGSNP